MIEPKSTSLSQVIGNFWTKNLKSSLYASAGCNGSARGSAQVGVVEIRKAIRGCAYFAAHPTFFPCHHRFMSAHSSKERRNCIAVADDYAIDPAYITGFRGQAHTASGTDERQRGFRSGTGYF
jgi:hypothetical protein